SPRDRARARGARLARVMLVCGPERGGDVAADQAALHSQPTDIALRPRPLEPADIGGVIEAGLDLCVLQRAVDRGAVERPRGRDDRVREGVAGAGLVAGESALAALDELGILRGLRERVGGPDDQLVNMFGADDSPQVARGRIARRAL